MFYFLTKKKHKSVYLFLYEFGNKYISWFIRNNNNKNNIISC